jgi:zinc transporter ZupT
MWSIILNTALAAASGGALYSVVSDIVTNTRKRLSLSYFMNYGLVIGGVLGFIKGYTGKPVLDLIIAYPFN